MTHHEHSSTHLFSQRCCWWERHVPVSAVSSVEGRPWWVRSVRALPAQTSACPPPPRYPWSMHAGSVRHCLLGCQSERAHSMSFFFRSWDYEQIPTPFLLLFIIDATSILLSDFHAVREIHRCKYHKHLQIFSAGFSGVFSITFAGICIMCPQFLQ